MAFLPPAAPKSLLGRHRLLAPSASVRVSPLCLGGIGNAWSWGMGECTKEMSFDLFDTFYDLGGNFIDTANTYQSGESEKWIGEWIQKTGRRSELVLATKYTMSPMSGQPVQQSNYGGTGTKSLHVSIQNSLKALQTDYVDILYVHCWDFATEIPELMHSLNALINQGKVLYLGISDSPAWVVTKANMYARQNGLRPFSVYQGRYSAQERDLEREVIPMCQAEGMAFQPFGVLGGGYFKSPGKEDTGARKIPPPLMVGREEQVSKVLDTVATRHNVPITSVALAYVLQKTPYIFPVLGGRKVEHLKANIEALSLELTPEDIQEIEGAYEFDLGFPHKFMSLGGSMIQGPQDINILSLMGHFDYVAPSKAIKPHKGDLTTPWKDSA
ncbi:putative norsolorinic acid reductase protein [Eutypa lata UCREL1]|uniref:Putative norsolorinic acid reductase protein n=1 Tax=Eutypa lata (strain UCR-EL1) TaxID=1287681 RepID=M7T335_EUTLA|nr:putative norsolorinic acid reductase protein [Eutypa lata UCREL1]